METGGAAGVTGAVGAPGYSVPRLALGLAVLAAEQVRHAPVGDGLFLAVGIAERSADRARRFTGAVLAPGRRAAARAGRALAAMPLLGGPVAFARERMAEVAQEARLRGAAAVEGGRFDASVFLTESVDGGVGWAQREVVPPIVDGLVPHLVAKTLPQLIEGAMPEIRLRVLPAVVDDLTTDPKVRDLVAEQGRGMLGEAADELRTTAADADDRVESAVLRLLRRPARTPAPPSAPQSPAAPEPPGA